jgi:hypothetical protein
MSKLYVNEIAPKTTGGAVVIANRPFFHASTGSTSDIAPNAVLDFSKLIEDTESGYSTSNKGYTIPLAGLWNIKVGVRINSNTNAGQFTRLGAFVTPQGGSAGGSDTNSYLDPIVQSQGTGYNHFTQDFILRFAVNDFIDIRNYGQTTIQQQANECHFQGIFMGT